MSPLSPQQPGTPKMCEKGVLSSGIIYYLYNHCGHLHPDVCVWEKSNDTVDGKIVHHLWCPKRFYWYKNNISGIINGAGFFPSTEKWPLQLCETYLAVGWPPAIVVCLGFPTKNAKILVATGKGGQPHMYRSVSPPTWSIIPVSKWWKVTIRPHK